jgi:uncharacterized integral membrane protein
VEEDQDEKTIPIQSQSNAGIKKPQNFVLNLIIVGFIILILSIIFMMTISKQEK